MRLLIFLILLLPMLGHARELALSFNGTLHTAELKERVFEQDSQGQHYQGVLKGIQGSWVRLSQFADGHWEGMAGLEGRLYSIELPAAGHSSSPVKVGPQQLLALSDSKYLKESICGVEGHSHSALLLQSEQQVVTVLDQNPIAESALVSRYAQLCDSFVNGECLLADLEVAFDAEFQDQFPQTFPTQASALLNMVEGYYSGQFRIGFRNLGITFLNSTTDVFSDTTNASALLDDIASRRCQQFNSVNFCRGFGGYTEGDRGTGFLRNPFGLFHLVTGRDFQGGTAGVAFLASTCSRVASVGTSQLLGGLAGTAVVVAHEIGHNLGASHDGENNACGNGFIMQAVLGGTLPTQFSSCSQQSIEEHVSGLPAQTLPACFSFPTNGRWDNVVAPNPVVIGEANQVSANLLIERGAESPSSVRIQVNVANGSVSNVRLGSNVCAANALGQFDCTINNPVSVATLTLSWTPESGESSVGVSAAFTDPWLEVSPADNQFSLFSAAVGATVLTSSTPDTVTEARPEFTGAANVADNILVTVRTVTGQTLCQAAVSNGLWRCRSQQDLVQGTNALIASLAEPALATSFNVTRGTAPAAPATPVNNTPAPTQPTSISSPAGPSGGGGGAASWWLLVLAGTMLLRRRYCQA